MKGVVFTEFLDLVDQAFGMEMAEQIIDDCDLPSGGVYTSVGTYEHEEIVALVTALSTRSGKTADELLHIYGEHLFGRFSVLYPEFFVGFDSALDFLASVHDVIHTEVLKLYPDATLPKIPATWHGPDQLSLRYSSPRKMEELAAGLIQGCITHFNENIDVAMAPLPEDEDANGGTLFTLTRKR